MLAIATALTLITAAAIPLAVVSDPVIAGIFSVSNTILNAITLYILNKTLIHSREAASESTTTRQIMDNRKEQLVPPPDNKWKREFDPPGSSGKHRV